MPSKLYFFREQGVASETILYRFIGKPHAILGGKFGGWLEGLHYVHDTLPWSRYPLGEL
jgi:hypothetical protein